MSSKFSAGRKLQKEILSDIEDLSPMPEVMYKAQEVMEDPDSTFKDLSHLVESDQALAVKILKMANSAYYRRRVKVNSIHDAITVLGLNILAEIIAIASSSKLLGNSLEGYELAAGALWRHSIAVAFCAKLISKKKFPELVNQAFTAGLIHDSGKLILDSYILERQEEFKDTMTIGGQTFLDAEKVVLGFDHSQIAAKVCEKWKIPKPIAVAVKYHHKPSGLGGNNLAHIVHVADQISIWSGMDTDGLSLDINESSMQLLDIQYSEIDVMMDEIVEYVNQVTSEMEM